MMAFSGFSPDLSEPAAVFQLPADLTSLRDKVRCSYMLYRRTGFNYTNGGRFFDAPFIQWQFDRDNLPKTTSFLPAAFNVTCSVNSALISRNDTVLTAPLANAGCFPPWARVTTPAGHKSMAQLAVGDKVLAVDAATGKAVFDDVYLVPHRDADATTTYLNIHASPVGAQGSSKVLTLSPRHYMPTACGAQQQQVCLKHAVEVAAGDLVWLVEGRQPLLARVDQVGLYLADQCFLAQTSCVPDTLFS
jgi:hypothetical protein